MQNNRIYKTLKRTVQYSVVLILIGISALLFYFINNNRDFNKFHFGGYQVFVVLSGSMEPELDTGSIVLVKRTTNYDYTKGDIVTFHDKENPNMIITHRIIDVNNAPDSYITKGDANQSADSNPVADESIIGLVKLSIPYVGYLLNFVKSKQAFIFSLLVIVFIIYELSKRNKRTVKN